MHLPRCETEFNLDRHIITFLNTNAFYAELSRRIYKYPTRAIPTAAVVYHKETDDIALVWNPEFFESMTHDEIMGVLKHEFMHLIFGHLNERRKEPPKMWNVATDLAINSLIVEECGEKSLPSCVLLPGKFPSVDGENLSEEQKAAMPVAMKIASMPRLKASEWYFNELQELADKLPKKGQGEKGDGQGGGAPGDIDLDSFDSHDGWDDIPEDMREYIEHKIKNMVEKAVNVADQSSTGWGNIPQDLRSEIRRSVSNIIPWPKVLKQFLGTLLPGDRTSSIKRINKRYPYIHPGIKRGRVAKLLIAIDQSGSVDNQMLESFFGVLSSLSKLVDIDILPFDYTPGEVFKWKKGTSPTLERTKAGGTSFDAPMSVINDPCNRGKWDGMLIVTDGECSAPQASRIKRGWVIGAGHKLMFNTDELLIEMTNAAEVKGSWR